MHSEATVGLTGSWSIDGAASRVFEWESEVRWGGVFPSIGHTSTNLGCVVESPQFRPPDVILAVDTDGFAWAKLADDDVFIPFRGKATVDHAFHATATLDGPDGAPAPRVTVSVATADASAVVRGGLGPGDTFAWGNHRAKVVRIVAPAEEMVGVIGWVEVDLSGKGAPTGGP